MKIALISHRLQRQDGQGRVNYEIVKAALERGHEVTMLAAFCAEDLLNHPLAHHVSIGDEWIPTGLLKNIAFAWSSARWLRRHRKNFDIIQATGFITWENCDVVAAHFVHSAWGKSSYYPFVSLSPYSLYQRLFTSLNAHWEKRTFLEATRVVAVSKHVARQLTTIGVPADKIRVIYNGVDTDHFRPGESDRVSLGTLPQDVALGLFVGDIRTPRKNLDTVLRAMQQVPDLYLAVAGGTEDSPFPALAEELGLSHRVIFLGKISAVATLMRSVDLFVFPSRYEAHPLVVLEAMASGLPMILSGTFGAEDFVGSSARIVADPNDASAIADALKDLLRSPEQRRSMGLAGRQRALEMQWSTMAGDYLKLYEELVITKR